MVNKQFEDQIDLLELAATLWRGKWLVAGITLVFLIIGTAYLWLTPQNYVVEFPVNPVNSNQLISLQVSKNASLSIAQLEVDELFRVSMNKLQSVNELKAFWIKESNTSGEGQVALEGENLREFKDFTESLSVVKKGKAGEEKTLIRFEGVNPELMPVRLEGVLAHVNKASLSSALNIYLAAVDFELESLDETIAQVRHKAKVAIDDQVLRIIEARKIAESLGIEHSAFSKLANIEVKFFESRLYLLGTKALDSELLALQERKGSDAFVPGLRGLQASKAALTADRERIIRGSAKKVKVFDYPDHISAPLEPVSRRPLILIISVFLGGMLGVVLVLVRQGVRSYRDR